MKYREGTRGSPVETIIFPVVFATSELAPGEGSSSARIRNTREIWRRSRENNDPALSTLLGILSRESRGTAPWSIDRGRRTDRDTDTDTAENAEVC